MIYKYWEIFATYNEVWCCLLNLGTKRGDVKHQREVFKNTPVSIIHQHALKFMKCFLHKFSTVSTHNYFLLMDDAMKCNLVVNQILALTSFWQWHCWTITFRRQSDVYTREGCKEQQQAFSITLSKIQSLFCSLSCISQPEVHIYMFLDWTNLSPFVVLPTASAKLETD